MSATATKSKPKTAGKTRLQPLGDRVVVEREESEARTSGGILLPDSAKDKPSSRDGRERWRRQINRRRQTQPAASEAWRPRAFHELCRRAIQSWRSRAALDARRRNSGRD